MSDLRTYQTMAYLTHQPDRCREILGIHPPRKDESRWLRRALSLAGAVMTRAGQWMVAQAGEAEDAPAISQTRQIA